MANGNPNPNIGPGSLGFLHQQTRLLNNQNVVPSPIHNFNLGRNWAAFTSQFRTPKPRIARPTHINAVTTYLRGHTFVHR